MASCIRRSTTILSKRITEAPVSTMLRIACLASRSMWPGPAFSRASLQPLAAFQSNMYGSSAQGSMELKYTPYNPWYANLAMLSGVLGSDIEVHPTPTGAVVGRASMRVTSVKEQVDWYDLEFQGPNAESAAERLGTGSEVHVQGRIRQDTYTLPGQNDRRTKYTIVVEQIFVPVQLPSQQGWEDAPAQPARFNNMQPAASNIMPPSPTIQANVQMAAPATMTGNPSSDIEHKWQQLFNNPSSFWDNRFNKRNPKQPDFKSKTGDIALWLDSKNTPAWVFDKVNELPTYH